MNKKVLLFLVLMIGLFPLMTFAKGINEKNATNNYSIIIDDANNELADDEINEIKNQMVPLSQNGNIIVKVARGSNETDLYHNEAKQYFQKYSETDSLLIYVNIPKVVNENDKFYDYYYYADVVILTSGDNFNYIDELTISSVSKKAVISIQKQKMVEAIKTTLTSLTEEEVSNPKETETTYINPDTHYRLFIDDGASLLSTEEIAKLKEDMKPLTEYGHIAFISISDNPYGTTDYYADQIYHSNFSTESGSIFLIDMDLRNIYIFSDGSNYNIINNSKAYSITDNVYKYASNEEYYECAHFAYKDMLTLLQGKKIAEPMRYTSNVFLALTVSFLLSFAFVMFKSKHKKAKNKDVLKNCDIYFKLGKVSATKTGSHREYSPVSDSSSGGSSSSGGGGGGGGSSGGGGGHSF